MMTEKFTSGEWRANECRYGFTIETDEAVVVQSKDQEGRFGAIENGADAHLISAAPDMYEALRGLLRWAEDTRRQRIAEEDWSNAADVPAQFDTARAALKKAVPDA